MTTTAKDNVTDLRSYTSAQVAKDAGITYRVLDYWLRTGRVRCLSREAGSGHTRQFTARQRDRVIRFATLYRLGLGLDLLSSAINHLDQPGGEFVVTEGDLKIVVQRVAPQG